MKFQHWWRLCPSKHTIRAWCTEKQCQPLSLNKVHNLRAICVNRGKYFRSHRIYKNDDLRTKMCYASFDTRSPTFWWCECVFFRKLNLIIVFCVRKHLKREQLAALAHTCIVALTHTHTNTTNFSVICYYINDWQSKWMQFAFSLHRIYLHQNRIYHADG